MTTVLVPDRQVLDRKILDSFSRELDPRNELVLKFVEYILLESSFTCKTELVEFLLLESKKCGYSILRSLFWV
ncbi:MAG: hypothetical protein ACXAEU_25170 [Candidatus Hodarchaeales archaeon]|jgi:hypothetical protein